MFTKVLHMHSQIVLSNGKDREKIGFMVYALVHNDYNVQIDNFVIFPQTKKDGNLIVNNFPSWKIDSFVKRRVELYSKSIISYLSSCI